MKQLIAALNRIGKVIANFVCGNGEVGAVSPPQGHDQPLIRCPYDPLPQLDENRCLSKVIAWMWGRHLACPLAAVLITLVLTITGAERAIAHPLGNFTINHFARLEVGREQVHIHYVVDMAEIPTFQTLQAIATSERPQPSEAELHQSLQPILSEYAAGIHLSVNDQPIPLHSIHSQISLPPGMGGLPTLRLESDWRGSFSGHGKETVHHLRFEDTNHRHRIGWHEIVVVPSPGIKIFNSSAFGNAVTDELRAYPEDLLSIPLDERVAELSWTAEDIPADATPLLTRTSQTIVPTRDRLAELITTPEMTPTIVLVSLLLAIGLGSVHAFSPGHGKTLVGAYLIGAKATAQHAAFLALTVTITHTIGVFALGLVTLFAAQYILPERLFPILSLVSGAMVVVLGVSLFVRRLSAIVQFQDEHDHPDHPHHQHPHSHHAQDHHVHGHSHKHPSAAHSPVQEADLASLSHTHDGHHHSHLPPGVDGSEVTWQSLLALGISGGLIPCPSALVVLLAAIALHRVGFGLLLVVAFSLGLAATLTSIGLLFIYARRWLKPLESSGNWMRRLSVMSALAVSCIGFLICYGALKEVL